MVVLLAVVAVESSVSRSITVRPRSHYGRYDVDSDVHVHVDDSKTQ